MFSSDLKKQINSLFDRYPQKVNALLPILHLAQEDLGCVNIDIMKEIADLCEIPLTYVEGVVTFYTMYHQNPEGKLTFNVCTNISCWIKGGNDILAYLETKLDIHSGETTKDMNFSIKEVECLGACGFAPVMTLNDEYHENVTKNNVDSIINSFQTKQ